MDTYIFYVEKVLIKYIKISKMKNLGRIARFICILALMIASLIVHMRW